MKNRSIVLHGVTRDRKKSGSKYQKRVLMVRTCKMELQRVRTLARAARRKLVEAVAVGAERSISKDGARRIQEVLGRYLKVRVRLSKAKLDHANATSAAVWASEDEIPMV